MPAPYGGAGYMPVRTDGLAIGALITGVLSILCSFVCIGIIIGPAAAVMGFISNQRIKQMPGTLGGGGLALAGIITGIIGTVLTIIFITLYVIGSIKAPSTGTGG